MTPHAEARVAIFLLRHRADVSAIIVVRRIDQSVVRQRENLRRIAALEIRPATAVDQQRVVGKDAQNARKLDQITVVRVGMAGREQRLQGKAADTEGGILGDAGIGAGKPAARSGAGRVLGWRGCLRPTVRR